jgi:hypothetical protein
VGVRREKSEEMGEKREGMGEKRGRVSGNMAFRYMDYGLKVRRRER